MVTDAEDKGFIVPGKVHGGRLSLLLQRLPLVPLSCGGDGAFWHRLQNSHGELLSCLCSSPPVALSLWPSSHGYGSHCCRDRGTRQRPSNRVRRPESRAGVDEWNDEGRCRGRDPGR